jgi:glutaminyl-peptide cyclotransferase
MIKVHHDNRIFTEGLYYDGTFIYESSGILGKSFIQKRRNNQVVSSYYFDTNYFAEGLTLLGETLFCITYNNPLLFYFNKDLKLLHKENLKYFKEGW